MIKFSANYTNSNNNFVIQNLKSRGKDLKYYPVICIVKNILQRGIPTTMSKYLQNMFPEYILENDNKFLPFIDYKKSEWIHTIKGDADKNDYPAKEFYDELIPKYFDEYKFVQNLIIPEASFSEITGEENEEFINQQVDFYLPQCKLVIEIDGQQHKKVDINRINDEKRDNYFRDYGILTVRIDTHDLRKENIKFKEKIDEILSRCKYFNKELMNYEFYASNNANYQEQSIVSKLKVTALIRMQLTILSLIENCILSLNESEWNISVFEHEGTCITEFAILDTFQWIKHCCRLAGIKFTEPKLNINYCRNLKDLCSSESTLKIDFSLLKRWTDENNLYKNIIFVRTDYYDNADYFKVSVADAAINYNIILDGEDSNLSSLKFFLNNIFGFEDFVEGQLAIIVNSLRGNHTIGLLPTGGGKSLCYQLVALLQPCVSFVVVPIKSLMYDQMDNLEKKNITRLAYISGDDTGNVKDKIAKDFAAGKYFFILISPERFQIKTFRDYLSQLNLNSTIAYAVIDEVHCLSEWGHDFRTSYLNLCNTIVKYCPSVRFLGLSATASINVLKDILIEFDIGKENVKTLLAYTRPELHFRVEKCKNDEKLKSLKKLINDFDGKRHILRVDGDKTKCGLIFTVYAGGKFGCLGVSEDLSKCYPGAVNWYAGGKPKKSTLSIDDFDDYKKRVQTDFKANKFPLLAATKAFGLGIDKPNIRFTIHYGIPGSLEALYQEAGRAGRDKKDAGCYILYSTEHMEREKYNKLFELNTTMEEIIDIVKSTPIENTCDVLRNFYLWTQNNKGVDYETHITSFIFNEFAKPGEVKIIDCGKLNEIINEQDKMSIVQKAIYRLSLLEIVDDWTIEKFGKGGILEVTFNNFDEETIKRAFLTYINKYDIEFDLKEKYRSDKYKKYYEIIDDKDLDYYERFIRALIQWNYDNVIYHRRQSLKTLVDLCENYSIENEENFKKQIESYFTFTENTFVFDYLAENPLDYVKWFELFYKDGKDELKSIEEFQDMNTSLKRFLESYRYNTALNYISGMLKLFLGEFDDINGRDRLLEALKDIDTLAEQDKKVIFKTTLKLGSFMRSASRINLGEILCEIWKEKAADIYKVLEDNASLYYVIDNSVKKLKNIGGSLL